MDDEPSLEVFPNDVIQAFIAAKDHTETKGTPKEYLDRRWQVALAILDRAVCESDRGRELMKAKAQAAANKRGDGNIIIGKPE